MPELLIPAIVIGAATVLGNVINAVSNKFTNDKNASAQKEVNATNLDFARQQFEEQKYLNRNQYQLAAADMEAAGINPAMAAGGVSLTAGSYSSNQEAVTANPYSIDTSAISDFASTVLSNYTNKRIAKGNNETQVKVAEINAESQEKMNADRIASEERIAAEDRASRATISANQLTNQKAISDNSLSLQEKIAKANALRDDYLARSKVYNDKITAERMIQDIYGQQIANEDKVRDLYERFRDGKRVDSGSELGVLLTAIQSVVGMTAGELENWIRGQTWEQFRSWYLNSSNITRNPEDFSSWSD